MFEQTKQTNGSNPERPVLEYQNQIENMIKTNNTCLIVGKTGSGKSTELPLMIQNVLNQRRKPDDKSTPMIAITQPRRIAAKELSWYAAQKHDKTFRQKDQIADIGYHVRNDKSYEETRLQPPLTYMTDGILLEEIQQDQLLRKYSAVMVDEDHERSTNIDLTLGMLKLIQVKRQEAGLDPLKIVVTSATLESEKFQKYFNDAPVLEIPGKLHDVEVHYENEDIKLDNIPEKAAIKAAEIAKSDKPGDILIFMPRQREIEATINELNLLELGDDIEILPFYSNLDDTSQRYIFDSTPKRRIIVSTNIAETSLTLPKVRHVIDSGLINQKEFEDGVERMVVVNHSKSGCDQRMGRAGRVDDGDCYRLFTKEKFDKFNEHQVPELHRSDLTGVVFRMMRLGLLSDNEIKNFPFIEPPTEQAYTEAIQSLIMLGAIEPISHIPTNQGRTYRFTSVGEKMANLPLEPKISRMVVEAQEKSNSLEQICTIAAFLDTRPVFNTPKKTGDYEADQKAIYDLNQKHNQFKDPNSDFVTLIKLWNEAILHQDDRSWFYEHYLSYRNFKEVLLVRKQLFQKLALDPTEKMLEVNPDEIGKCVASGLLNELMEFKERQMFVRRRDAKSYIKKHPSSATFREMPKFIVATQVVEQKNEQESFNGVIYARNIQSINPNWIPEIAPHLVDEKPGEAYYDRETDRVVRKIDIYFKSSAPANIFQDEDPFTYRTEEAKGPYAAMLLAQDFVTNLKDFDFIHENRQIMNRVEALFIKTDGQSPKPWDEQKFIEYYGNKLAEKNISTRAELRQALESKELNLDLNYDELIQVNDVEIPQQSPDYISVGNKTYAVRYVLDAEQNENRLKNLPFVSKAMVNIPIEEIFHLYEIPILPNGKQIQINLVSADDSIFFNRDNLDLEGLRKMAKKILIGDLIKKFNETNSDKRIIKIADFVPTIDNVLHFQLPSPILWGQDPISHESLITYPAIIHFYDSQYAIQHFFSKEAADEATQNLIQEIKEDMERKAQDQILKPYRDAAKRMADILRINLPHLEEYPNRYRFNKLYLEDLLIKGKSEDRLYSELDKAFDDKKNEIDKANQPRKLILDNFRNASNLSHKNPLECIRLLLEVKDSLENVENFPQPPIRFKDFPISMELSVDDLKTRIHEQNLKSIQSAKYAAAALANKNGAGLLALLDEKVDKVGIESIQTTLEKDLHAFCDALHPNIIQIIETITQTQKNLEFYKRLISELTAPVIKEHYKGKTSELGLALDDLLSEYKSTIDTLSDQEVAIYLLINHPENKQTIHEYFANDNDNESKFFHQLSEILKSNAKIPNLKELDEIITQLLEEFTS